MKTRLYKFALPMVIIGLHQNALAMEAPPLTQEQLPAQLDNVKKLTSLCADRLVHGDIMLENAEDLLHQELKESVKKALIYNNLLLFADIFKPLSLRVIKHENFSISSSAVSECGRYLLTGAYDQTARLWDLHQNPPTYNSLKGHTSYLTAVALNGEYALTGSRDSTVQLWNLKEDPPTSITLPGHDEEATAVAFSHDGRYALAGYHDGVIRLWDLRQTPITAQALYQHARSIKKVAFSKNDKYAIAAWAGNALLYNLHQESAISPMPVGAEMAYDLSPDGNYALTGDEYGVSRMHFFDLQKNAHVTLHGTTSHLSAVAFSPDGTSALTGWGDGTVQLWLQKNHSFIPLKGKHSTQITSVAFSADGRYAATHAWCDGTRLWDLKQPSTHSIALDTGSNLDGAFSTNGRYILARGDNDVALWDLTGEAESLSLTLLHALLAARLDKALALAIRTVCRLVLYLEIERNTPSFAFAKEELCTKYPLARQILKLTPAQRNAIAAYNYE